MKLNLPFDYLYFLAWSNRFSLFGTEILGIQNQTYDLMKNIEWKQNKSNNLMPKFIIPFSPVGNGDYYCFDLSNGLTFNGICNIIYWQWNYSSKYKYQIVNSSFVEWLRELINDSIKDDE